jgi:hypothetical protein
MMFLFLFLTFAIAAGTIWLQGLWSAAITLVNLFLAMFIATNFWEPICTMIDASNSSFTYLTDVLVLWGLFAVSFGILRAITDLLAQAPMKFSLPVEMTGRSILALYCGWMFVCFTAFSLNMAPLNSPTPMGAWQSPQDSVFFGADRIWLGFMQMESRGALSRGNIADTPDNPKDQGLNVETFDPFSEFPVKYHARREKYSKLESMRVN